MGWFFKKAPFSFLSGYCSGPVSVTIRRIKQKIQSTGAVGLTSLWSSVLPPICLPRIQTRSVWRSKKLGLVCNNDKYRMHGIFLTCMLFIIISCLFPMCAFENEIWCFILFLATGKVQQALKRKSGKLWNIVKDYEILWNIFPILQT